MNGYNLGQKLKDFLIENNMINNIVDKVENQKVSICSPDRLSLLGKDGTIKNGILVEKDGEYFLFWEDEDFVHTYEVIDMKGERWLLLWTGNYFYDEEAGRYMLE